MSRLVRDCGWGAPFCFDITSDHIIHLPGKCLYLRLCVLVGEICACWYFVVRANVTHPETGFRNVVCRRVGIHSGIVGGLAVIDWITTQTHRPGGALDMNNSATVGDYSGPLLFLLFSGVTDRHAAPRLCGHPAWILQDVLLITPYEYQNTIRLFYILKGRKAWRSCVDFSSCEHVDFSEVLGDWGSGYTEKMAKRLVILGWVCACVCLIEWMERRGRLGVH